MKEEAGNEARALMLESCQGVLSTLSKDMPGYPFGSVAPYCLDEGGRPLLLISEIAQHTKNLRADARCSLIVIAGGDDIQATARLTLVGECEPLPAEDVDAAAERYYRYFPESRDYHRSHDFSFFRLQPQRCRFIGGFGRIHWLDTASVLRANPFPGEREAGIVTHMNDDHADALRHYCAQAGIPLGADTRPVMVGIDAEGLHLRLGSRIVRLVFPAPVATPLQARETLVAMARAGR
jgi:putative heme iron utilization protein